MMGRRSTEQLWTVQCLIMLFDDTFINTTARQKLNCSNREVFSTERKKRTSKLFITVLKMCFGVGTKTCRRLANELAV
jgi:hypothetical protein